MSIKLIRYRKNPILAPVYWWEERGVFNPSVTRYKNQIYMVYRAHGSDGISRLGLAISEDGLKFKKNSKFPIIESSTKDSYSRLGIEDPRVTKIDDTYYITYTKASVYGLNSSKAVANSHDVPWKIRVGLTTTKDWQKFNDHGVILNGYDSKNASYFPVLFNHNYALVHRIGSKVYLSFSRHFNRFNKGKIIMISDSVEWQQFKIGICSPPIDFDIGWLSTFHGVSLDRKYRVGFVLFDKANPSKIIYRSHEPILSPIESYEKWGSVKNVVFATGLIEFGDELNIYYGAADTVVGLAQISKIHLLNEINKTI